MNAWPGVETLRHRASQLTAIGRKETEDGVVIGQPRAVASLHSNLHRNHFHGISFNHAMKPDAAIRTSKGTVKPLSTNLS